MVKIDRYSRCFSSFYFLNGKIRVTARFVICRTSCGGQEKKDFLNLRHIARLFSRKSRLTSNKEVFRKFRGVPYVALCVVEFRRSIELGQNNITVHAPGACVPFRRKCHNFSPACKHSMNSGIA